MKIFWPLQMFQPLPNRFSRDDRFDCYTIYHVEPLHFLLLYVYGTPPSHFNISKRNTHS